VTLLKGKTFIHLSVLCGLTPKASSTNTVNTIFVSTLVPITACREGIFSRHVLGHHLSRRTCCFYLHDRKWKKKRKGGLPTPEDEDMMNLQNVSYYLPVYVT